MDLFSDPFAWRGSELMFAGMSQYPSSAADPNKPAVQELTDLIVLGGCNLSSPQFEGGLKDCDRLSTSSVKSSLLTIYNIESDGSRLRGFGRTSPCTISNNTLSFNVPQPEDVDHGGFHDYHVSSHMINAQEDGPTIASSPGGSNHAFASGFQIPDEVEDLHPPCGALPYGHTFEGSYAIGSCFGTTETSHCTDESLAKTAIKSHALYPYLVTAHINCCQVGAKAADLKTLEEAHSRHQHLEPSDNMKSSPFTKPELDSITAWYLGMLLDMKEKVEEPFCTEMEWCNEVLEKLKLLGPATSPIPITGWGGEGPSDTGGKEGSAYKTGETRHLESSIDKRNGVIVEQCKQDTIVKQWLRSKHDRSEIYNLRGQCKKKRRQGKHPETARERLVEWFNGHGDWPYPSEEEKLQLAGQTNLEARQINNWFINQRKRHWDSPAKEEIIHRGQQYLESQRPISNLETFVKDRFNVPMNVFNPL